MKKLRFEPLDLEAWRRFCAGYAPPTFYARAAWAEAIERVYPQYKPAALTCRLEDGSEAMVPLMRQIGGRFGWKICQGMPFGSYTVVLNRQGAPVEPRIAGRVFEELLTMGDAVLLNPWPLAQPSMSSAFFRQCEETSVIDISGGVEAALSRVGSKSKRMAGQARRRGVSCEIETGSNAIDEYYNLLEQASRDRWQISEPRLTKDFIRQVSIEGGDSVEVWIARFEGQAVGAGIALYGSEEVLLWTTVMRPGMENLKPHNILHLHIIEHAAGRGVHWYNLGSSAGMPGVLRFKASLGATSLPYNIIGHESIFYRANVALRRVFRS